MPREVTEDDTGLQILRQPYEGVTLPSSTLPTVDIIAIHGIGAHPDDTWTKKGDGGWVNWLSDAPMLPAVAPNARIMRYGYQFNWITKDPTNINTTIVAERFLGAVDGEREDCDSRPIIFIAHCFGGLVLMKALSEAHKSHSAIFDATIGILFLGTPFRGAPKLSHDEILLQAALEEYGPDNVYPEMLQVLNPGNELLGGFVDEFCSLRKDLKAQIACFYEMRPSKAMAIVGRDGPKTYMVSKDSGCLDLSDLTMKYSLNRNHFEMNKFAKPNHEDFQTVKRVIKKMITLPTNETSRGVSEGPETRQRNSVPRVEPYGRFQGRDVYSFGPNNSGTQIGGVTSRNGTVNIGNGR